MPAEQQESAPRAVDWPVRFACDLHEVQLFVVEDAERRDPAAKSLGIGGMFS